MSSPAQSLASVMKVPSNSCLPCRAAFCSFCLGSLGASSGSLRQHTNAHARHTSTTSRPARKVKIDDKRKHHHFRTLRQSSSGIDAVVASSSDEAIPRGREASSQARHALQRRGRSHAGPRATELAAPPRAVDAARSIRARVASPPALPTRDHANFFFSSILARHRALTYLLSTSTVTAITSLRLDDAWKRSVKVSAVSALRP